MSRGHFIQGSWVAEGNATFASEDPATGKVVWTGPAATSHEVDRAVGSARRAGKDWAARPLSERASYLRTFSEVLQKDRPNLAEMISIETGKPLWESLQEVDSMVAKIELTIQAHAERQSTLILDLDGSKATLRYRPMGVLVVLGPFNMPGHIPNGQIVPALLSGNTVVFKPSRQAAAVAQRTVALWEEADIPPGVVNLIQGSRRAVAGLVEHPDVDGLFFTGSFAAGTALHESLAGRPEKILALEMGGNNPLVVFDCENTEAAVVLTVLSAFLTSGQRCTCARRLIVTSGSAGDMFIGQLANTMKELKVGSYTDRPEPFCGPVISCEMAAELLSTQDALCRAGASAIVEMKPVGHRTALLRPGLLDVTGVRNREDKEWFGPILQVVRVNSFDAALLEATSTSYGLAAGLLSDSRSLYDRFAATVRAGHIVWNRQTTGASGRLPFGGLKSSGNHRPAGYFAVDSCSDPVASLETETLQLPSKTPPGLPVSRDRGRGSDNRREWP